MKLDWILKAITHPDWILSPLTQYVLCAVCLGGSLLLWVSCKKELLRVRSNAKKSYDLLSANFQELSASVETIRETCRPAEPVLYPQTSYPGFDLARRTEALRMFRRNEPVTAIVNALGLHRNEIELLLKIDLLLNPN